MINVNVRKKIVAKPRNEYLEHWERVNGGSRDWRSSAVVMQRYTSRRECVRKYAFAIPNQAALDTIAKYAPIVELGAGTGYWSYLLRQMGVRVVAIDEAPIDGKHDNHFEFEKSWTEVVPGGPADLVNYLEHTLMLCWPNYNSSFAYDALKAYGGKTCIYIGEGWGGCTGDEAFHELLSDAWNEVAAVDIPQWDGIHDALYVYERKETP